MQQREVIFLVGQTGSGKSWLAQEITRRYTRVLVASGFDDFPLIEQAQNSEELLHKLAERGAFSNASFRLKIEINENDQEFIFSLGLKLKNCLIVIDEADRWDFDGLPDAREAIYRGRHYGVSLLFVGLRPVFISTGARSQITRIAAFRTILPDDVQTFREICGLEAMKLVHLPGPPDPPPNPFLYWSPSEGSRIEKNFPLDKLHLT